MAKQHENETTLAVPSYQPQPEQPKSEQSFKATKASKDSTHGAHASMIEKAQELRKEVSDKRDMYLACAAVYSRRSDWFEVPGSTIVLISTLAVAIWPDNFWSNAKKISVTACNMVGLGLTQLNNYLKNKDKAAAFAQSANPLEDVVARLKFAEHMADYESDRFFDDMLREIESDFRVVVRHAHQIDGRLRMEANRVLGKDRFGNYIKKEEPTSWCQALGRLFCPGQGKEELGRQYISHKEDDIEQESPSSDDKDRYAIPWQINATQEQIDFFKGSLASIPGTVQVADLQTYQNLASSDQPLALDDNAVRAVQQTGENRFEPIRQDIGILANNAVNSVQPLQSDTRKLAEAAVADSKDIARTMQQTLTDPQSSQRDVQNSLEDAAAAGKNLALTIPQNAADGVQPIVRDVRRDAEVVVLDGTELAHSTHDDITKSAQVVAQVSAAEQQLQNQRRREEEVEVQSC